MRRLLVIGSVLAAAVVLVVVVTRSSGEAGGGGYEVRAIFDNAFSLIEGEDVRVSGVNVGKITELEVTPDNRAAVVLDIQHEGFRDFRRDATCTIRPQSLIGEKYVECTLTQPRPRGQAAPPPLRRIAEGEPGEGQRLLPVEQTTKPVDIDLVNNITRLPERQRLAVILNELGAGVAGRGEDLNETIRRANPALGATNQVLKVLASQNRVLRQLAIDSDTILEPLARDRQSVADFVVQANEVSKATAERRADLEADFERLPRFLEELRPTMTRLQGFADEFEPALADLRRAAPDINRLMRELGPFSQASIPAIDTLGEATQVGRPALVRTKPIVDDLRRLLGPARPLASNLRDLTVSFRDTGGIERLMDYLFFQVAAINGYDSYGHYLRAGLIVNTCTQYSATPQPGCSARYASEDTEADQAMASSASAIRRAFAARAGEDHSAGAMRGTRAQSTASRRAGDASSQPALRLPSAVLPGQGDTPAPAPKRSGEATGETSGATTPAQESLLDYLLGDGS